MVNILKDMVTCLVICADGNCVCKLVDGNVFLISSPVQQSSWLRQAHQAIKSTISIEVSELQLYRWFKVLIPSIDYNYTYVSSVVFQTQISLQQRSRTTLASNYFWMDFHDLRNYFERKAITCPVLLEVYPKLRNFSNLKYEEFQGEFAQFGAIVEITNSNLYVKNTTQSEIFINSTCVKAIQMLLYKDFFSTCLPNVLMSMYHFTSMMAKFGIKGNIVQLMFKAADTNNASFISYRGFACVVAVIDPQTEHIGQAADFRKTYIFRMFDKDNDLYMVRNELENLLNFVRAENDPDVRSCIDVMKMGVQGRKLSLKEFIRLIDNLHLKGLSKALRGTKNCLVLYADNNVCQDTFEKERSTDFSMMQSQYISEATNDYALASHTLRVMKSGTMINIEDIWSLKEVCSYETLRLANITRDSRRLSCEINSPTVVFNEIIKSLRVVTIANRLRSGNRYAPLKAFSWDNVSNVDFGKRLIQVCVSLRNLLLEERRLLEIKSPVYILGSLHGNYGDLAYFERILWPRSPGYCPGTILLLGNYVDRAPYGIETISYLFCYKNLFPNKVHLIRGYHEIQKVQMKDIFYNECCKKFGSLFGGEVMEAVNCVFDCLPLAAVIDDRILCVHSGIPNPNTCTLTKFFNSIPVPLTDPEKGSSIAWEIISNEPVKESSGDAKHTSQAIDGFAKNVNRGNNCYTFTHDSLYTFLDTNFYSHLIRTCDPVPGGFTISARGRLITIFSSSKYNHLNNDACCLLAEKGKIRAIRLSGKM